ncbi:hypothetical protein DSCW_20310 [Desulfosarcina widdelii]|uniref:Tripartite ATP-independent periplasmic transporters DctQ component domain-containing protein n=1 Tax=Desulfosarcina widdelii TaxID=947919 RepID=A0A5K7Z812_9BACT|nr:TRAP transporter small permease [Desulfosarcina widdelii]BBO74614.1 hypothetical protein DSCW_20310 [Desulfosarcina widdelii]
MIQKFNKIIIYSVTVLGRIGMFAIAGLMIIITVDTILRYFFNNAFLWTYDISTYLMVGFTYLAIAYTELREDHVTVDMFIVRFSKKTQLILNIINRLIMLGLSILITRQSWIRIIDSLQVGRVSSGPVGIPQVPVDITMFIGCLGLCFVLVVKLISYGSQLFGYKSVSGPKMF